MNPATSQEPIPKYIAVEGPIGVGKTTLANNCLLYTSPSPRDAHESRMPSSA